MRKTIILIVIILGVVLYLRKSNSPKNGREEMLQRPLITGASVSADYNADSPGKRLAQRYTAKENIRVVARPGNPGLSVEPLVTKEILKDRTVIIAVDFLFWDSTLPNTGESKKALD